MHSWLPLNIHILADAADVDLCKHRVLDSTDPHPSSPLRLVSSIYFGISSATKMRVSFLTVALAAGVASALSKDDIPSDTPVSSLLASAQGHLSRGETSEALVYYDAAVGRDPSDYLTYFKRATTYLSLGRASQATDDFTKVLALRPGFEAAHLQLGKIKQRVADWDGAREQLRQAKGSATEAAELLAAIDEAEAATKAAEAAKASENWEECANQASVALMVASRAASLRKLRAVCRFARGEVEEGVGDLQHVLNIRPGDIGPHLVISAIHFYALGDFDKGTAQVRKCLQSDPDSKPCMALLKKEKAAQKTFAKVEKAFSKNQPSTGTIHLIPSGENPGLIQQIKDQMSALVADGILPAAAPNGLVSKLTSMACQGYYEVCFPLLLRMHLHVNVHVPDTVSYRWATPRRARHGASRLWP